MSSAGNNKPMITSFDVPPLQSPHCQRCGSFPGAWIELVPGQGGVGARPPRQARKGTGCERGMWWDGEGGGLWKEWIRSVYGRQVDGKLSSTAHPGLLHQVSCWTLAKGWSTRKTRDSNQQHQEVNSTQDRGTGSTSEESSTNGGY